MKQFFSLLLFSVIFGSICSCTSKSSESDVKEKAPLTEQDWAKQSHELRVDDQMSRTEDDTLAVYNLGKEFLELLKADRLSDALDMLKTYSGSTVIPATSGRREAVQDILSRFPVIDYSIDGIELLNDVDNELHYSIIFKQNAPGDNTPNKIKLMLNPFRLNGVWYLSVEERTDDPYFN